MPRAVVLPSNGDTRATEDNTTHSRCSVLQALLELRLRIRKWGQQRKGAPRAPISAAPSSTPWEKLSARAARDDAADREYEANSRWHQVKPFPFIVSQGVLPYLFDPFNSAS
jgi:hypothetical protein